MNIPDNGFVKYFLWSFGDVREFHHKSTSRVDQTDSHWRQIVLKPSSRKRKDFGRNSRTRPGGIRWWNHDED